MGGKLSPTDGKTRVLNSRQGNLGNNVIGKEYKLGYSIWWAGKDRTRRVSRKKGMSTSREGVP